MNTVEDELEPYTGINRIRFLIQKIEGQGKTESARYTTRAISFLTLGKILKYDENKKKYFLGSLGQIIKNILAPEEYFAWCVMVIQHIYKAKPRLVDHISIDEGIYSPYDSLQGTDDDSYSYLLWLLDLISCSQNICGPDKERGLIKVRHTVIIRKVFYLHQGFREYRADSKSFAPSLISEGRKYSKKISPKDDFFISYASENEDHVNELTLYLEYLGLFIWEYRHKIKSSDSILRKVTEGLKHAKSGIILLSEEYRVKAWQKKSSIINLEMKEICKKDGIHVITSEDVLAKIPKNVIEDKFLIRDKVELPTPLFAIYMILDKLCSK